MGTLFGLKAFAVAILGGITSAWGVMAAGLLFGIAEALITTTLGSGFTQILSFSLVIVALALQPERPVRPRRDQEGVRRRAPSPAPARAGAAGSARRRWRPSRCSRLPRLALQVNSYYVFVLANVALLAVAGIGLNVLLGLTGQVSLGHVGFYAIGAYTVALLDHAGRLQLLACLAAGRGARRRARRPARAAGAARPRSLPGDDHDRLRLRRRERHRRMAQPHRRAERHHGRGRARARRPRQRRAGDGADRRSLAAGVAARGYSPGSRAAPGARRCARCATRRPRPKRSASTRWRSSAWPSRSRPLCAGAPAALFAPLAGFVTPHTFGFVQSILFVLVVMIGGAGSVAGPLVGAHRRRRPARAALQLRGRAPAGVRRDAAGGALDRAGRRGRPAGAGLAPPLVARATAGAGATGRAPAGLRARPRLGARGDGADDAVRRPARRRHAVDDGTAGPHHRLIGPNGAGKTTALNMLSGFYRASAGSFALGDAGAARAQRLRIARAGVARTYQTSQLFGSLSVRGQRRPGGPSRPRSARCSAPAAPARRQRAIAARELLDFCGYAGRARRPRRRPRACRPAPGRNRTRARAPPAR